MFKVGDILRLKEKEHHSRPFAADSGALATVTGLGTIGERERQLICITWNRNDEKAKGQSDSDYDPIDFELALQPPEEKAIPRFEQVASEL